MIPVTVDTSVYIGTLNSRGGGSRLLDLARSGRIRIDTSEAIVSETVRVLRETFGWDGHRVRQFPETLSRLANQVRPRHALDVIKEDPPDNRILECAIEAGSDYIVTWDKDLLRLGEFAQARILTVPEFLASIKPAPGA